MSGSDYQRAVFELRARVDWRIFWWRYRVGSLHSTSHRSDFKGVSWNIALACGLHCCTLEVSWLTVTSTG